MKRFPFWMTRALLGAVLAGAGLIGPGPRQPAGVRADGLAIAPPHPSAEGGAIVGRSAGVTALSGSSLRRAARPAAAPSAPGRSFHPGVTGGAPGSTAARDDDPPRAPADASTRQRFWAWDFHDEAFYELWAREVHGSGRLRIYVEEGQAVPGPALLRLATAFEDVIYPRLRDAYGSEPLPGIDGDTAVTILLMDIRDGRHHGVPDATYYAGYFDPLNEARQADLPRGRQSNEREMIYIDVAAPTHVGGDELLQTVAHEFTHLIVWNHDPDETDWLTEGICQLAIHLAGLGHPRQHVLAFLNQPDDALTRWTGSARDYGKVHLFLLYLYDQLAREDPGWLRRLVSEPANGMDGLARLLPPDRSPSQLFRDYALALFVNTPTPGAGRYAFASIDLGQPGGYPRARPNTHPADRVDVAAFDVGPWSIRADAFVVKRTPVEISITAAVPDAVCVGAAMSTNPTPALAGIDRLEAACLDAQPSPAWVVDAPARDRATAVFTVVANAADTPTGAEITPASLASPMVDRTAFLPIAIRR